MANTQAYFGFTQYQGGAGGAPTFTQSARRIASSNSTAIYTGDPVMPVVSTANGYITQAAPGTTTLAGIFVGCKYLNTSLGVPFGLMIGRVRVRRVTLKLMSLMIQILVSSFRQAPLPSQ